MKPSTLITIVLASAPALIWGECFGGDKKRPDHGLEVIEFMYSAGCALQQFGNLEPGKEFKKSITTSDGVVCSYPYFLSLMSRDSISYLETSVLRSVFGAQVFERNTANFCEVCQCQHLEQGEFWQEPNE
jgi:hypothetical protein